MTATTDIFDRTAPADLDDEQLEERVIGYASQIDALTCRMLTTSPGSTPAKGGSATASPPAPTGWSGAPG